MPRRAANVIIVFGFPWHTGESEVKNYLLRLHPHATPVTVRLYTNPANGSSRGICFVEYNTKPRGTNASPDASSSAVKATGAQDEEENILAVIKKEIEETPFGRQYLTAALYHLTGMSWDRGGRLPELPTDPPPVAGGVVEGYGGEGFTVRCGAVLGLANTVTPSGAANMHALRKRLRTEGSGIV